MKDAILFILEYIKKHGDTTDNHTAGYHLDTIKAEFDKRQEELFADPALAELGIKTETAMKAAEKK